jgi:4-amino-4-deoxy-L-arabinose transferase-like glycosyltransferase
MEAGTGMSAGHAIAERRGGHFTRSGALTAVGGLAAIVGAAWLAFITVPYVRLAVAAWLPMATGQRASDIAMRPAALVLLAIAGLAAIGLAVGAARRPGWSAAYVAAALGLAGMAVLGLLTAGRAAWPVAVVLWLVVLGAAAGGRLLDRLFAGGEGPVGLERATFGLVLAFGLASHAVLALGLLGGLYGWLVAGLLLGLSALLRSDLLAVGRGAWRGAAGLWTNRATMSEAWFRLPLFGLLAGWTVLVFIQGQAPEVWYDAQNYHLALPELYAEQHRIVPTPYRIHSYLSLGTEMLYLLATLLGGQTAARLISLAFGVLTALGIFALGRRWFSARAGLLAATLFATTPIVAWEASGAFVDLALGSYCFFAVAAAHRWLGDRRPAWLILAGLLGGFALSAKLNALLLLGALGLVLLLVILVHRELSWSARFRALLSIGGAGLLAGAPWPLFRWIQTGNPVFPFFNHIFRSPLAPAVYDPLNLDDHSIGTGLDSLIRLPWEMTFSGPEVFQGGPPGGSLGLGVLVVPLLLAGRWAPRERIGLLFLAGVVLVFAAAWAWTSQFARYFFPALPTLYVLVGAALAGVQARAGAPPVPSRVAAAAPYTATLVWALAGLPLFLALYVHIPERLPYRVAFGAESRPAYVSRTAGISDAFRYLNERSPGRGTLILAFTSEQAHLYSNGTVASMYSPFLEPILTVRDPGEALALIRDRGFGYLVIDRNQPRERLDRYVATQKAFLDANAELEHRAQKVEVYRLLTPAEQAARAAPRR